MPLSNVLIIFGSGVVFMFSPSDHHHHYHPPPPAAAVDISIISTTNKIIFNIF
jgi:hypothetical protein